MNSRNKEYKIYKIYLLPWGYSTNVNNIFKIINTAGEREGIGQACAQKLMNFFTHSCLIQSSLPACILEYPS